MLVASACMQVKSLLSGEALSTNNDSIRESYISFQSFGFPRRREEFDIILNIVGRRESNM